MLAQRDFSGGGARGKIAATSHDSDAASREIGAPFLKNFSLSICNDFHTVRSKFGLPKGKLLQNCRQALLSLPDPMSFYQGILGD